MEGKSQSEIIDYIGTVAKYYGIRMRHDNFIIGAAAPDTNPPVTKRGKQLPVDLVRQSNGEYTLKIDTSTVEVKRDISRVILSLDKNTIIPYGRKIPLFYECNGLILDAHTWKPLVVPPFAFNYRFSTKLVEEYLNDSYYDIIKIDDGTIVTIYHWNHPINGSTWSMSSSNGYDVSTLYWSGNLTYSEVFFDLVTRLYPEFVDKSGITIEDKQLKFTGLDPNYCYTVGFRHHNFHPLKTDPERIWQIQVVDMRTSPPMVRFCGANAADITTAPVVELPGIPNQTLVPIQEIYPKLIVEDRLKFDKFKSIFTNAINDISASPPVFNYGYILRSRKVNITKDNSDLLIESPLLSLIRKTTYEKAPRQIRGKLTSGDRLEYNAIRAFLTIGGRDNFLSLYPEWREKFNIYDEFIKDIKTQMIRAMRNHALAPITKESPMNTITGRFARVLLDQIIAEESIKAFHKDTESIIADYIVNPKYTYLYMRVLQTIADEKDLTSPTRLTSLEVE
jgi:hypothetical protein